MIAALKQIAKQKAAQKVWRENHKEAVEGYQKKWRAANMDRVRAAHKKYQVNNPEKVKGWHQKSADNRKAILAEARAIIAANQRETENTQQA
jgi:hypothetical protein